MHTSARDNADDCCDLSPCILQLFEAEVHRRIKKDPVPATALPSLDFTARTGEEAVETGIVESLWTI